MRQTIIILALLLTMPAALAADTIGVSAMGYHSDGDAKAFVYTHNTQGNIAVYNANTNTIIANLALRQPIDNDGNPVTCLGNLNCLEANLSYLPPGNYYLKTPNSERSRTFAIHEQVYSETIPIFFEWFNAHMMQNSSYHANYFGSEQPPFALMADGAFLMESTQTAIPLIRISEAYRVNPVIMQDDKYDVVRQDTADSIEYVVAHVDYLRSLQANNGKANIYDVPLGYTRPWGPWLTSHPDVEQYTNTQPSFIVFSEAVYQENSAQAAYAYTEALPALAAYDISKATEQLEFTLNMLEYLEGKYTTVNEEYAAYLGAAYLRAYDFTGNWTYIEKAYALRDNVSTTLYSDSTKGNEFYWKEYIEHQEEIIRLGFQYELDGTDPLEIFLGKLFFDYKDFGERSMVQNAERAFDFDRNVQFSNSRYMLLEGVFASEAALYSEEAFLHEIADAQLSWLTGANAVQHNLAGGQLASVSFINGIGSNTRQIHSRITPPGVRSGQWTYSNGMTYIPGWISGAYDKSEDLDIIRNYDELYWSYTFTETTNEMVALGLQLAALRDAHYNNIEPIADVIIINQSTPWPNREPYEPPVEEPLPTECSTSLSSAVATCVGGKITSDIAGGCRVVACSSDVGTLQVMACDKATFFEMYKQGQSDPALDICLDGTCIGGNGYVKSNEYASCAAEPGTLIMNVVVVNDNEGVLNAQDMSVLISGDVALASNSLQPGNYNIEPVAVNGYDFSLSGACVSGSVVISEAQSVECIVTFNDRNPTADICYDNFASLPASCIAGTLAVDIDNGCRSLRCENGADFLEVLACPKGDTFEMYRQQSNGNVGVCLGGVCMESQGFVKSPEYPLCVAPPTECTDADSDTYFAEGGACGVLDCRDDNALVNPAGTEICNGIDDNCNGQIDEGGVCSVCGNAIVEEGEECDGNTANVQCTATCEIERNASVSLSIAPWFPQGQSYVFVCEAQGFTPTRYDFSFGDGNTNNYRTTNDVYYTYAGAGEFDVSCTAFGEGEEQTSSIAVVVE